MRVLAIILVVLAAVAWFVQRHYRPTPEKAQLKLENANRLGRLQTQPPMRIEKFEVAQDYSVTAYLAQSQDPSATTLDALILQPLANKINDVIGKRVTVTFIRGQDKLPIIPE